MICKNIHYLHTMKWRNDEGGGFAWEVMNTMTSIMKVRLARKYDHLKTKKWLYPDQLELVSKLHDGTLEEEAARLTKASGHFQRTLANNSSDVLQLAVGKPNEPLRINAATFFSSCSSCSSCSLFSSFKHFLNDGLHTPVESQAPLECAVTELSATIVSACPGLSALCQKDAVSAT